MPDYNQMPIMLPTQSTSPTAVAGKAAVRSDYIYSALTLAYGAAGTTPIFLGAQGQPIPELKGTTITATANPHQQTYTDLTTPYVQSGQLGGNIGDVAVNAWGVDIEQQPFSTAGAPSTNGASSSLYGAGPNEMPEILNKCSLSLTIGNAPTGKGPLRLFPAFGGVVGSVSQTGNLTNVVYLTNGVPGRGRQLDIPIPIGRNDTLRCDIGVAAANASLVFSVASSYGQPTLVWVTAPVIVGADIRG